MSGILGDHVQRLQRLTDFNALLAKANQSIATVSDEERLLRDFCELAIRYAHFDLAVIARPDASGWFRFPVAAGAASFLDDLRVSLDPGYPEGRGSMAKVWREGESLFIDDSMANPILDPWRERYRRFGFKSSAVLPLRRDGHLWGLLVLFHAEINAFHEDLKALLTELALDLSRGLDHLDAQNLQYALLNNSVVGILLAENRIIRRINLRMAQMLGRTPEELEGQSTRILYADEREWSLAAEAYTAFDSSREVTLRSVRMAHKDGAILLADFSGVLVDSNGGVSVWTIADVTEQERNRQRLQRLSDFNALLSEANQVIARASEETGMLQSLCELAIRCGHLRLAWIGRPDAEGWFYPVAAAGEVGSLEGIRISAHEDPPEGRGPRGQAWRSQTPVFEEASGSISTTKLWTERAKASGLGASAALPVYRGGRLWAVFTLFHCETDEFDAELQRVLTDLAQDVGYGLDRLDLTRREYETSAFNRALLDSLTAGVYVIRYPERIFELANSRMLEMTGAGSNPELSACNPREFYPGGDTFSRVGDFSRQILREGHGIMREIPFRRLNGEIIYIDLSGQRLCGPDGAERIVWTQVDVTERHLNEQTIRQLSAARATLLANTTAGIDLVRYPERVFVEVNQGFLDILGYDRPEEVVGHPTGEFYPAKEEFQRMVELSRDVLARGQGSLQDLALMRKDGKAVYVDVSGQRLEGEDPEHPVIVWTSVDVTARHRLTEELARQALLDPLTGLPNRRAFNREFEKAVARAKRHERLLALVMIDLDHFKEVNDTYGHEAGDLVLEVISKRLQGALRCTDFLARMGGDEFILLIEDCRNLVEISAVLDKVEHAVRAPLPLKDGTNVRLDLSAGVSLSSHVAAEENAEALLRYSDLALYRTKACKNDRLRFWTLYGEDTPRQRTRA